MKYDCKGILFVLVIALSVHDVIAGFLSDSAVSWSFGSSAGILLPGIIRGSFSRDFNPDESGSFQSNPTFLAKVNADYNVCKYFGLTTCVFFAPLWLPEKIDLGEWDGRDHTVPSTGIMMFDFDAGLTTSIQTRKNISINPSVYAGFRQTFSSSPDARNSGVALDFDLAMMLHISNMRFWSINLGFISQPYGGVTDIAWVRGGPIFYINTGFGKELF